MGFTTSLVSWMSCITSPSVGPSVDLETVTPKEGTQKSDGSFAMQLGFFRRIFCCQEADKIANV